MCLGSVRVLCLRDVLLFPSQTVQLGALVNIPPQKNKRNTLLKRTQMVKTEHQISVTVRVYGPLKSYLPLLKQKKNVFLINVYFQKYNFSSEQCCCGYKCTRLLLFGLFHVHTFLVYSGSCQTNSWSGSTLLPLLFLPTFWKDFVQFSFFFFFF